MKRSPGAASGINRGKQPPPTVRKLSPPKSPTRSPVRSPGRKQAPTLRVQPLTLQPTIDPPE